MDASILPTRRRAIGIVGLAALSFGTSTADEASLVVVHKDPNCGCCSGWVDHLRQSGFRVEVREASSLDGLKRRLGIPRELSSCHTAEVGGFVVEGHVPADAIRRLLAERPRATGLAVPGMPIGSPGMEVEGTAPEAFEVTLFGPAGRSSFGRYRGDRRA